jgi:acyl-CoA hydrolase
MTTSDEYGVHETRIVEMVFPNQANHYGTLFGGDALRLMDMAAFVAAWVSTTTHQTSWRPKAMTRSVSKR